MGASTATTSLPSISIIQSIIEDGRSLVLTSRDIALLVLMRQETEAGAEESLAMSYSTIQALHSRLNILESGGSQNPERRLMESLERLEKAECVTKADMTRIRTKADSEYQITSLGDSLSEWHVLQSEFSGEPLTAIFRAFISQLSRIVEDAEEAKSEEEWHYDVILQMQHTLKGMLVSIQRHQKELDRQHASIRDFVPTLLVQGSEDSITQCEAQLTMVIKTIDDLQEVVLASTSRAQVLIDRISELARPTSPKGVEGICDEFNRRLVNISMWTAQRTIDWFEHHTIVHNHLRTVVRIDRQRRVTDALKRSVASVPEWTLELAAEPYFLRMRDDMVRDRITKKPPRVARHISPRERTFEELTNADNLQDILKRHLLEDISTGEAYASSILQKVASDVEVQASLVSHFPWLIDAMAQAGNIDNENRPWISVTTQLEVEEFRVTR